MVGTVDIKCSHITVPTFNSCTKCMSSRGISHDRMPDCHHISWVYGCMDDLTTESSLDSQATGVIDVLGSFFSMLSMGI